MDFIKIANPAIANELIAMGFKHITETVNNATIYCFADDAKIKEHLARNYANVPIVTSNRLHF